MTVYYTLSVESNIANVILCSNGTAWDYEESLADTESYDSPSARETDLIAFLKRRRDDGTLEDIFAETFDDAKYPASEVFSRFPDAIELT